MNRSEHLQWCKGRALAYVNAGDTTTAMASMASDLNKHSGTSDHVGMQLGMMLMMGGKLNTETEVREFIEGFN